MTDTPDPRQPAWDAVFAYIRTLPHDQVHASIVERNAVIWRAVNAALVALGYEDTEQQENRVPDALRDQVLTEAAELVAADTVSYRYGSATDYAHRHRDLLLNARTTKEN